MASDLQNPDSNRGIYLYPSLRNDEPIIVRLNDGTSLLEQRRSYPGRPHSEKPLITATSRVRYVSVSETGTQEYHAAFRTYSAVYEDFVDSSKRHIKPFDLEVK